MPTAEELVVSLRSQGAGETQEDIEGVEESLSDTTDELETQSEEASDFSSRIQGVMGAVVAGLALATGGILTQVPIIGEAAGGLKSIIDELALKIDEDLRGPLSGATDELFDIANQITKADGTLDALDMLAQKLGELGIVAIQFAIEEDVLDDLTDDIIQFVFPEIGQGDILNQLFSFDLSSAAVLTALFGGLAITASTVLTFMLPASISATAILSFLLPTIAVATVLSHVFDINMTKTAILGAIFGGVIITGAAVVGAISFPVIAGAAIIGTLFAGVTITAGMVLEELFGSDAPIDPRPPGASTPGGGLGGPGLDEPLPPGADPIPGVGVNPNVSPNAGSQDIDVILDGQSVAEKNGRQYAGNIFVRGGTR